MRPVLKCLAVLLLVTTPAITAAEGLRHVKQSIYGMDCAPCAYGLDKAMRALPGIESVKISLNEGYADLVFAGNATVGLHAIRTIARDNGFTPKDAQVVIEGTLQLQPTPQLTVGARRYELDVGPHATLANALVGQPVVITGDLATDSERIVLSNLVAASEAAQ